MTTDIKEHETKGSFGHVRWKYDFQSWYEYVRWSWIKGSFGHVRWNYDF